MITIEIKEDLYSVQRQLYQLSQGQDGGYVHSKNGQRIALCHCYPNGVMTTPKGLKSSDTIVCCHPNIARQKVSNPIIGNWDGMTFINAKQEINKCLLTIVDEQEHRWYNGR